MNETEIRQMIAAALDDAAKALRADRTGQEEPKVSEDEEAETGRPSRAYADFYLCGAPALADWRDRVGGDFTVFKAGLTRQGVADRQNDLREDEYGSYRKVGGRYVRDPGFDRWEMRRLPRVPLSADQAAKVQFVPRAVRIHLRGRRFDTVERRLRHHLAGFSLTAWTAVPANSARLQKAGIDTKRWTNAKFGDQSVFKKSCELYVIKPRIHLPQLVGALIDAMGA